jgi:hypothetical protein
MGITGTAGERPKPWPKDGDSWNFCERCGGSRGRHLRLTWRPIPVCD